MCILRLFEMMAGLPPQQVLYKGGILLYSTNQKNHFSDMGWTGLTISKLNLTSWNYSHPT